VASAPQSLSLKRNRDLEGWWSWLWFRRAVFAALLAIPALAAFNVFGQRPHSTTATSSRATLTLIAPERLRGGLLWSAQFRINALQDLKKPRIVLDPGWAQGMAINTIEPAPVGEASANGKLSFDLGHIPAGERYALFMQFQVNPTNLGRRGQDVQLFDGDTRLLSIDRDIRIYP
jgi:hypothetical protein